MKKKGPPAEVRFARTGTPSTCSHGELGRDCWVSASRNCRWCGTSIEQVLRQRGREPGLPTSERDRVLADLRGDAVAMRALDHELARAQFLAFYEAESRARAREYQGIAKENSRFDADVANHARALQALLPSVPPPDGDPYPLSFAQLQRFLRGLEHVVRWHEKRASEHVPEARESYSRWQKTGRPRSVVRDELLLLVHRAFVERGRAGTGPRAARVLCVCHEVVFGRSITHERALRLLAEQPKALRMRKGRGA